ncbi:M48 family metallopeptidase [Chloroflexia bacterium SDU3-3]|nr:M48 family metallopeptidase [Chloroflexia bacterium SDU3-3]
MSKEPSHSKTITVEGTTLTVHVVRKAVKNVNARLRGSTLSVSAPTRMPQADLDRLIPDMARKLLRRVAAHQINAEGDALALAQRVAARFPQRPEVAHVQFSTTQRARWGSYSRGTRTIRLHAALRHMPRYVLESVIAHELAHVIHFDHSDAFWALVRSVDPEVEKADAFLAGVTWLGRNWETLPPLERSLLSAAPSADHSSAEE